MTTTTIAPTSNTSVLGANYLDLLARVCEQTMLHSDLLPAEELDDVLISVTTIDGTLLIAGTVHWYRTDDDQPLWRVYVAVDMASENWEFCSPSRWPNGIIPLA